MNTRWPSIPDPEGDAVALAALARIAAERAALDALAAEVPRLTGSEIQQRLSAMQARLHAVDADLR
jgi:hypothetical protein